MPFDHAGAASGAWAILDGPRPHAEPFVALMIERIHRLPGHTPVLSVRRTAVARGGDERALFDLVAAIMERPAERGTPPCEFWFVDGLPQGRRAVLVKIHHDVADDVSATSVLTGLCDGDPVEFENWRLARAGKRTAVRGEPMRYTAVSVSMYDVLSVCDRFGVTVDDVALAAVTDSVRAAVRGRGDRIDPSANRFASMAAPLPVELPDLLQRLRAVHDRMAPPTSSARRSVTNLVPSVGDLLPVTVTGWAAGLSARLARRGAGTVTTAMTGSPHPVSMMGRAVLSLTPVPPVAVDVPIGIAFTSYVGELAFGITGAVDAPLDVDVLAEGIADGVARLSALTAACKRSRKLGPLMLLSS